MLTASPRERLHTLDMSLAQIPAKYWKARLDDFEGFGGGVEICRRFSEDIYKNLSDGIGLMIHGHVGHGKTHMACVLLKRALAHRGSGLFLETLGLVRTVIDRVQLDAEGDPITLIERAEKVDALVLDDLGAEHQSDFSKTTVEALIRHRAAAKRATFITTNLGIKELEAIYGQGIRSVLTECVYPVVLNTRDWRELRAAEIRSRFEGA